MASSVSRRDHIGSHIFEFCHVRTSLRERRGTTDHLLEQYIAEYRARGCCEPSVSRVQGVLSQWARWLRTRRPRPQLENVDADLLVAYLRSRTSFRSKATVYGTLSVMRGIGDYLVREGVWASNPLRWMRGPKIRPYNHLPRRLGSEDQQALWRTAASTRGEYSRHLWVVVLALLYGTGLRRGELERLDVECWDRTEGILRIGWPQDCPRALRARTRARLSVFGSVSAATA